MKEPILNSHNKLEFEPAHTCEHVKILSHDFNEGTWRVRWKVTSEQE